MVLELTIKESRLKKNTFSQRNDIFYCRNHPEANAPLMTEILSEAKARASQQLEETDENVKFISATSSLET